MQAAIDLKLGQIRMPVPLGTEPTWQQVEYLRNLKPGKTRLQSRLIIGP